VAVGSALHYPAKRPSRRQPPPPAHICVPIIAGVAAGLRVWPTPQAHPLGSTASIQAEFSDKILDELMKLHVFGRANLARGKAGYASHQQGLFEVHVE
jgi:hypothetical protein